MPRELRPHTLGAALPCRCSTWSVAADSTTLKCCSCFFSSALIARSLRSCSDFSCTCVGTVWVTATCSAAASLEPSVHMRHHASAYIRHMQTRKRQHTRTCP